MWPVHTCPECEDRALVAGADLISNRPGVDLSADFSYLCFTCSFEVRDGGMDECSRCGELLLADEMTICGDCIQSRVGAGEAF